MFSTMGGHLRCCARSHEGWLFLRSRALHRTASRLLDCVPSGATVHYGNADVFAFPPAQGCDAIFDAHKALKMKESGNRVFAFRADDCR
jgi:hypothetical protein